MTDMRDKGASKSPDEEPATAEVNRAVSQVMMTNERHTIHGGTKNRKTFKNLV